MHKFCAKSRLNKEYIQKGYSPILAMLFDEFPELKIESGKSKINLPSLKGEGEAVVEQKRNLRIRVREQSPDVQWKVENGKWTINIPCPGRGRVREGVISC